MQPVQAQYEAFPYPPVPSLALPMPGVGRELAYETGARLAAAQGLSLAASDHVDLRLLVVGCGTLEALVVAQAHPRAREVVALDLSGRSLAILRRRWRLAQLSRLLPWRWRRLPPLRLIQGDFRTALDQEAPFDYILANNVLHHTEDPAAALNGLARRLKPGGLLRLVTYPQASRIWMRRTGEFLRARGLTPHAPRLRQAARQAIESLPEDDPRRLCFDLSNEAETTAGLVDAFLHAVENPLPPLAWQAAVEAAGLSLAGEGQREACRSTRIDAVLPEARRLSPWAKLQLLDDTLHLSENPVLWQVKTGEPAPPPPRQNGFTSVAEELATYTQRLDARLEPFGLTGLDLCRRLEAALPPDERLPATMTLAGQLNDRESERSPRQV